jgi:hypothetical protein
MSSSSPPSDPAKKRDSALGEALPKKPSEFKSATAILLVSKGIQRIKSSEKKYSTLGEALPQKLSELRRGVARYATSDVNPVKNNETQQRKGTQDRSMDRFEWKTSTLCL